MIVTKPTPTVLAFLLLLASQVLATQAVASVTSIFPVDDAFETSQGQPVSGTVTTNDGPIFSFTPDFGDMILIRVLLRHGVLDWNRERGEFTYTPDEGFAGGEFFKYRYCETQSNPLQTTFCTSTARVTLGVEAVNQAPVAVDDLFGTDNSGSSILANDTDPNGNTLTAILVEQPLHGTVSLNSDGSFTYTLYR
jgi:hypothetical protein